MVVIYQIFFLVLSCRSNLLWLHTVFAVLYLILTALVLGHHVSQMKGMRRETVSAQTTVFFMEIYD